jgi:hypothetical protein
MYWVLIAGLFGGFITIFAVTSPPWSIAAPLIYALVGGAAVQYADLIMRQIECPRCSQPFFRTESRVFGISTEGWAYSSRRCTSCGITFASPKQ